MHFKDAQWTREDILKYTQGPVVQRVDNSIYRINHYPLDGVLCFGIIYPLDSDLSGGYVILPFNNRVQEVKDGYQVFSF